MTRGNHRSTRRLLTGLGVWLFGFASAGVVIICGVQTVPAAVIPPLFVDSVVALGSVRVALEVVGEPPRSQWVTSGSGFFYGYLAEDSPDETKRKYAIYLVTARHVVVGLLEMNREVSVRLNPKISGIEGRQFLVPNRPDPGSSTWFCHPDRNIDVALVPINFDFLKQQGIEPGFLHSDRHAANRDKLKDLGASAGDGIFVLGFPMGLSGVSRNYVIVRQGVIARVAEMLDRASSTFMIDALVFPGNSGGPVVLRPDLVAIEGTKNNLRAYVVGVVTSYRPYIDTAFSLQTRRPRVTFEENSGLADVLPMDVVDEAIRAFRAGQASPCL